MSTYPVVVQLLKVPVSNPGFWTRFCAKEAVGITARAKPTANSPRRKMRSARELCSLRVMRSILETMTAPNTSGAKAQATRRPNVIYRRYCVDSEDAVTGIHEILQDLPALLYQ